MRLARRALITLAAGTALAALSTGVAIGGEPISLDGEVELTIDLEATKKRTATDLVAGGNAIVGQATAGRATVEAAADVLSGVESRAGGHLAASAVTASEAPDDGDGLTARIRVPASVEASAADTAVLDGVATVCIGVGILAGAPGCDVEPAPSSGSGGDGVTALARTTGTLEATGAPAGADVFADACVGVGLGAAAPGCAAPAGSADEPDEGAQPDTGSGAPLGGGTGPGTGEATGPAESARDAGMLPDTALDVVGLPLGGLALLMVGGAILAWRRREVRAS